MRKFEKISYEEFQKTFGDNLKLYQSYKVPERKTTASAGYDFESLIDATIHQGEIVLIPTGIKCSLNENDVLLIVDRSSLGFKYNIRLVNQVGVIDSDYYNNEDNEGHIFIKLQNEGTKDYHIEIGSRIAQGIIINYQKVDDENNLNSKRKGGIGSTDGEKNEII